MLLSYISSPTSSGCNWGVKYGIDTISTFFKCDVFCPHIDIVVCFTPNDLVEIFPIACVTKREHPVKPGGRA